MLATNHVLAGALIGRAVKRPVSAFAIGIGSHLVMDALPHWGMDVSTRGAYRRFLAIAALDGSVLATALAVMVRRRRPAAEIAGSLGALLLDMDKPTALLGVRQLWPDPVHRVHIGIQRWEQPRRWRIDAAVAAALLVALAATD